MLCIHQGLENVQVWGSQIADPFSLSKQSEVQKKEIAIKGKTEAKNMASFRE